MRDSQRITRSVYPAAIASVVVGALALVLACVAPASGALAQATNTARAEQLFRDGKARLLAHDYAAACPLLAQSVQAEPATGALLALALCHERAGKLASAQREYAQAADRSHAEQRADREQAARDKVSELASKVSTLTIERTEQAPDVQVRLDGQPIADARLGQAIGVDGGEHTIEATAKGKRAFQLSMRVADSAERAHVVIPELQDAKPVPAAAVPLPAPERAVAPSRARQHSDGLPAEAWVGLGTLGAGVVALGAGTVFAVRAARSSERPTMRCDGELCTYRASGSDDGDAAALSFVVGGLLVATGGVIYLVSKPAGESETASNPHAITAGVFALPGAGGACVRGRF